MFGSKFQIASPIVLQATATVPVGGVATPSDVTTFRTIPSNGLLVDEIRFQSDQPAGWIGLKMNLGRQPLTSDFIPIWLFGKDVDELVNVIASPPTNWYYVWRFSTPLYVPPEMQLLPTFKYFTASGVVQASTSTQKITYICRSIPATNPEPRTITIPWVSAYKPATVTGGTASSTVASDKQAIYNPFDVPVTIKLMVGRISDTANYAVITNNTVGGDANHDSYDKFTNVRIYKGDGSILVRDPTPLGNLCSTVDYSWPICAQLGANEYFNVYMDLNYSSLAGTHVLNPMISAVGERTILRGIVQ